jgi:DNA-binding winged helix-turn-helix (wHTH) protein
MQFRFADFILNVDARQLTRGGEIVPLEPKMFTLLDVLVQRRPAVVTYAELDELLWPKVYVARTSLTRLVSELRTVLGDPPSESQIIRTAYKTGYAFAADVTALGTQPSAPGAFSLLTNGRLQPLAEGTNVAGRDGDCAVVVDVASVSRRHACFTVTAGVATVEDLGSTNGTFVNGVPVSTAIVLANGDEIMLGKAIVQLRVKTPPPPTEVLIRGAGESAGVADAGQADSHGVIERF